MLNLVEHEKCFITMVPGSGTPSCPRSGLSWFHWWVSFAPEFQFCYYCESYCLFYLSFNFDFLCLRDHALIR